MRKQRILLVNASDPWSQRSGYFIYSARLADLLARHYSVLSASLFAPAKELTTQPAPTIRRMVYKQRLRNAYLQRLLSIINGTTYCERAFAYPGAIDWLRNIAADYRPDLVIFNHILSAWAALRIQDLAIPTIYLAHNAESIACSSIADLERNPIARQLARVEAERMRNFELRVLNNAGSVIVLTDEDKTRITAVATPNAVGVVPPCLEIPEHFAVITQPIETILMVGSYHWRPKRQNALWFLRNVYTRLQTNHPGLRCVIVGANASVLEGAIDPQWNVSIHSDVPDVRPFLLQGSVFVTPERQLGGIKLKTCEAAAYGLPIVSTRPGLEGTGLIHGDSCLVADTSDEMVQAIDHLLGNVEIAVQLGGRARQQASSVFSERSVEASLLAFLGDTFHSSMAKPLSNVG